MYIKKLSQAGPHCEEAPRDLLTIIITKSSNVSTYTLAAPSSEISNQFLKELIDLKNHLDTNLKTELKNEVRT